jgi:hypothetical protein
MTDAHKQLVRRYLDEVVMADPGRALGTVPPIPAPSEYAEPYRRYVERVTEANILTVLGEQIGVLLRIADKLTPEREVYRYAPGKWSIRQMVGHLIDSERVFACRAYCFSRGETAPMPSFDENLYAEHARSHERSLHELMHEFTLLRAANILHFRTLSAADWGKVGTASGYPVTVRALAYIMAGHVRHHLGVLKERYGVE